MSVIEQCSVLFCTDHYSTTVPKLNVYMFEFPEDAKLRAKWIEAIHREGFEPTQQSRVCEKHFKTSEIQTVLAENDEITDEELPEAKRMAHLVKDTVPSRWLDPAQLTSRFSKYCGHFQGYGYEPDKNLKTPDPNEEKEEEQGQHSMPVTEMKENVEEKADENAEEDDDDDYISSYSDLQKIVRIQFNDYQIMPHGQGSKLIICKMLFEPRPEVIYSVSISRKMDFVAYQGTKALRSLDHYKFPCKIYRVSEIRKILNHLKDKTDNKN